LVGKPALAYPHESSISLSLSLLGELKWFKLKAADGTVEHHGQHFVLKQVVADVEAGFERSH